MHAYSPIYAQCHFNKQTHEKINGEITRKNTEYNNLWNKGYNMNKIKAVLHNRVLLSLMKKDNYITDMVVVDQL